MKRLFAVSWAVLLIIPGLGIAQQYGKLPSPDTSGGLPLMQTLKERKSSRSFADKPVSPQILSNLLWAAFGINRPDGRRTAPSAMNWQEIDIYIASQKGLFIYDAQSNLMKLLSSYDIRGTTGTQDFVKTAPVNLIYVADMSKVRSVSKENEDLWVGADCGFIAQNVYLFCASEGLVCVVRGSINKKELANAMNLRPDQKIILAQSVGYPK